MFRTARALLRSADERQVEHLTDSWRAAAEGAGLVRRVDTVSGPTIIAPRVEYVILGPPTSLRVRLEPGQTAADVRAAMPRLAPVLGVPLLRVEPIGVGREVWVTLLDRDPLDEPLGMIPGADLLLGRMESGSLLRAEPADLGHLAVQGQTGSGKSTWLYGFLGQLAPRPDVLVAGIDPSGLTLRPFTGTRHADRQALGLADLDRIEAVAAALVDDMDARLAAMPLDVDTLPLGPGTPLVVVVLEEWPATLRALDAADTKRGKRVRALVARLLAESRKVGYRVVLAAQRAEASILGAAERAQCSVRLSFRSDNRQAVELLHPDVDPALADEHTRAVPGVALLSVPGWPVRRLRAPHVTYREYAAAVRSQIVGDAA